MSQNTDVWEHNKMSLLDEALAANGGLARWQEVETITIHQLLGGELWKIKGVDGIIDDSDVRESPSLTGNRGLAADSLRNVD